MECYWNRRDVGYQEINDRKWQIQLQVAYKLHLGYLCWSVSACADFLFLPAIDNFIIWMLSEETKQMICLKLIMLKVSVFFVFLKAENNITVPDEPDKFPNG